MAGTRITQLVPRSTPAGPGRRYGALGASAGRTIGRITQLVPRSRPAGPGALYGSFAGKAPDVAVNFVRLIDERAGMPGLMTETAGMPTLTTQAGLISG